MAASDWHQLSPGAQHADDEVEQRHRHLLEARRPAEQFEQLFALLPGRDGLARPTDRQHAVVAAGILQARGEVVAQVIVADRLAGRQRAVAKHEEGLALPDTLDLPRQRLEEGRRPHDRVGQTRFDEHLLELQFGLLESEQRLLHADRRQQHDLSDAGALRCVERSQVGAVVDRPGVLWCTGARGQARHQRVEALAAETVTRQRDRVGDVADAQRRTGEQPCAVLGRQGAADPGAGAHETDHLVTTPNQRAHRRPTDGSGGAEDEDALARHARSSFNFRDRSGRAWAGTVDMIGSGCQFGLTRS